MTREEVKGQIARCLMQQDGLNDEFYFDVATQRMNSEIALRVRGYLDKAEAILNLKRICPDCKGGGEEIHEVGGCDPDGENDTRQVVGELCPACKGTGGDKILAVLAENQVLPFAPYYVDERIFLKIMEFITTPKDGTVWRKTKV